MKHCTTECGFDLVCHGCGASAPAGAGLTCVVCGTPRSLRAHARPMNGFLARPPRGMWRYFVLLPVKRRRSVVSLGEGATPLVVAPRLARALDVGELRVKNEAANPTGSFKDRQVSVSVSHARENGAGTVAAVSSGNVAASVAAYAARAGLRAVLFMHAHAGPGKIAQASAHGARIVRVDSPSPAAVFDLCREACARRGWRHVSTAGMYDAYTVEGAKTIAYELYQQYRGNLPDWIVMPVGGGGLLGGLWRGLLDLERLGLIARTPRLAGVQAAGCAPLRQAMDAGWDFLESLKHPWPNPDTVAGGIADDILFDGHTALPALRATGGAAIVVSDDEIIAARKRLARDEGLLCELTAATAFAALPKLPGAGPGARVCVLMTGNGLKESARLAAETEPPEPIAPDMAALDALLNATGLDSDTTAQGANDGQRPEH